MRAYHEIGPLSERFRIDNKYISSIIQKLIDGDRIIDLLLFSPNFYQTLEIVQSKTLDEILKTESEVAIEVTIFSHTPSFIITKGSPYKIIALAPSGEELTLMFFAGNAGLWKNTFKIGSKYLLSCKISKFGRSFTTVHPKIFKKTQVIADSKIVKPRYPLSGNLTQEIVSSIVSKYAHNIEAFEEDQDWHKNSVPSKRNFISFKNALRDLHFPKSETHVRMAKERLAYDELLVRNLAFLIANAKFGSMPSHPFNTQRELIDKALKVLPFELTKDQLEALEAIFLLQKQSTQKNILLQGDVGSGKTVVALLAAVNAIEAGFQVAIMSPTFILARQTFEFFQSVLKPFDIPIIFLSGGDKGKKRKEKLQNIAKETPVIVIGTHALFSADVTFQKLGFVIIDEQHRFGIAQRLELTSKAPGVKTLLMTATPIPRTLSMALFGDIEVCYIKSKPKNRKDIITKVFPYSRLMEVIDAIKRKLKTGEQVYWVVPLIEEAESKDPKSNSKSGTSIEERYQFLKEIFGEDMISAVHGKMKDSEIELEMQKFQSGKAQIMLATTVIEVGVDVKAATVIIIESAENFGLSSLHQLRGRVGRGTLQSYCFLLYQLKTEHIMERLNIIASSNDGFFIAEKDMQIRGSGSIFSKHQSGFEEFKFFQLSEHSKIAIMAKEDAKEIFQTLQTSKGSQNFKNLMSFFGYDRHLGYFKN